MAKIEIVKKQYEAAGQYILGSEENFMRFLEFQSRVYKMSFFDAVMVFYQNPKFHKVAELKVWNRLGRRVKRNSKAVAVLGENNTCKYLFDISQTYGKQLKPLWHLNDEICKELISLYSEKDSTYQSVFEIIEAVNAKSIEAFYDSIIESTEKMQLNQDETEIFKDTILSCSKYITACRCEYENEYNFYPKRYVSIDGLNLKETKIYFTGNNF